LININLTLVKNKRNNTNLDYFLYSENLKNNEFYNDKVVNHSFSVYSTLFGEALLVRMQSIIENVVNVSLFPTYSFSRIYYYGSLLKKHTDRNTCQYSASLCIKNDVNSWPIWLEKKNGEQISIELHEGDMLIYKGCELSHWRDTYQGKRQIQILLHYVDKNGEFAEHAFDKREYIYLNDNYG